MEMELHYYQSVAGRQPFVEWMEGLKDARSRAKIEIRLARVVAGNFGDVKSVGDGVRIYNVRKSVSKISRTAQKKKMPAFAPSAPYEDWLLKRLKNPVEAAAYLEEAIADGDQAVIMLALRQVAQAQGGIAKVAQKAKLTREATYRMLSTTGNPELRSLTAVLAATGLRLAVKVKEKRAA